MEEKIQTYINNEGLFNKTHKIIVATSGGIDSMVLCTLLHQLKFNIAIAHCNFQLRGEESDMDQTFVHNHASQKKIPFYTINFDTITYCKTNKVSVQVAARELRYTWLEQLRKDLNANFIAIAHNKNDNIETFFINLLRGSGINGLSGINNKNKRIVRPLLTFSRAEIINYATHQNIHYREDSSNESTKYLRNKIRHHIIPIFEDLEPHFIEKANESLEYLNVAKFFYKTKLDEIKAELIETNANSIQIDKTELLKHEFPNAILYEILNGYGFNKHQVSEIINSISCTGKLFYSTNFLLNIDRNKLIIKKTELNQVRKIAISDSTEKITEPISLSFKRVPREVNFEYKKNIAYINYDKLEFPLILRKWKHGDRFKPFGMNNEKKISDYLIDAKVSIASKEEKYVLISDSKIIWLVGERIHHDFRIKPSTKNILKITLNQAEPFA